MQRFENARVRRERDYLADVEDAIGPTVQPVTDTRHECIVDIRVTDGATQTDRFQATILIKSSFDSQNRVELD